MQLMKMGGFLKTHYVHIQHAETKLHSPHKTSNHRHETRKQHITAFIAETHFKSVRHDTHTHTVGAVRTTLSVFMFISLLK